MSNEPEFHNPFQSPEPQRRSKAKGNFIVWILVALGVSPFICGGVGFFLANKLGNNVGALVDSLDESAESVPDNQGDRSIQMAKTKAILTEVLEGNRYQGVSPKEVKLAEAFVKQLSAAMEAESDRQFRRLVDEEVFQQRVFESSQASSAARAFRFQYEAWIGFYCPSGTIPRMLSVSRNSNGSLTILTSMNPDGYNKIVSWEVRQHSAGLAIADWLEVDAATFHSDQIAREFSSAVQSDLLYDNYMELMENGIDPEDTQAAIARLLLKEYPPQLQAEVFVLLAQYALSEERHDLVTKALAKIPSGYLAPEVLEIRARDYILTGQDEKALEELQALTELVGPLHDPMQFQAEVLGRLGRHDDALDAWLTLLRLDAAQLANYSFTNAITEHLPPARADELIDAVQASNGSPDEITEFASSLIDYSRPELATPLLTLFERDGTVPAMLVIDAKLARADGDIDTAISKYREAMAAGRDHASFADWQLQWAQLMEETEAGDVAIRESSDPAQTFFDLAIDDDYLMVDTETARKYATALGDAKPKDENLKLAARLWSRAGFLLADLEDGNDSAWKLATELHAEFSDLSESVIDGHVLLSQLGVQLDYWVAEAGVKSQHVGEAYGIIGKSPGGKTAIINQCLILPKSKQAAAITALFEEHEKVNPDDPWLDYCRAELLIAKGDTDAARAILLESYSVLKQKEANCLWRMRRWLSDDAVAGNTWKTLVETVPLEDVFASLTSKMQSEEKLDGIEDLFVLAKKHNAIDLESWLRARISFLNSEKRWSELADLARYDSVTSVYGRRSVLDALLINQQFDEADEYISRLPGNEQPTSRAQLLIAQGGSEEELIRILEPLDSYSTTALYYKPYLYDQLQTDAYAGFRNQFPRNVSLYSLATRLLLCVNTPELTTASIKETIAPTMPGAEVTALAGSLQVSDRGVKLWRVDGEEVSLLLSFSQRQYDEGLDDKTPKREHIKVPTDKEAVERHDSWIAIDIDWQKSTEFDSEDLANRLAADFLSQDLKCVVVGAPAAMTLLGENDSEWVRLGKFESEETFQVFRQFVDSESWRIQNVRDGKMRRKLVATENPSDLKFGFEVSAGPVGWKPVPVEVQDWAPQYRPASLNVTLPDSPLIPRIFRAQRANVSAYLVVDLAAEAAVKQP